MYNRSSLHHISYQRKECVECHAEFQPLIVENVFQGAKCVGCGNEVRTKADLETVSVTTGYSLDGIVQYELIADPSEQAILINAVCNFLDGTLDD